MSCSPETGPILLWLPAHFMCTQALPESHLLLTPRPGDSKEAGQARAAHLWGWC